MDNKQAVTSVRRKSKIYGIPAVLLVCGPSAEQRLHYAFISQIFYTL